MSEMISIILVSNHRYLPGLSATMVSMLLSASDPKRLEFNIFYDDLTESDLESLKILNRKSGGIGRIIFHKPDLTRVKAVCSQWNGSYLPWLRMFVTDQVEADWAVYADVDTLWFKDICQLWKLRDDRYPILWAKDMEYVQAAMESCHKKWNPNFDKSRYCCSGMVLMNLKRMRELDLAKETERFIKRYGCPYYVDQDVLNYLFNGTAGFLDQTWLCMRPTHRALQGAVLHCLGIGRMFNGPMRGWSASHAIWYRFYNKHILGEKKVHGCGFLRSCWYHVFGLLYPCRLLYKVLTIPCASHRAEQLTNMQFAAWLYVHSGFGR